MNHDPDSQPILAPCMLTPNDLPAPGELLCHCREVRTSVVVESLSANPTNSVAEITHRTGAGGECGSCRSMIALMIKQATGTSADMSYPDERDDSPAKGKFNTLRSWATWTTS